MFGVGQSCLDTCAAFPAARMHHLPHMQPYHQVLFASSAARLAIAASPRPQGIGHSSACFRVPGMVAESLRLPNQGARRWVPEERHADHQDDGDGKAAGGGLARQQGAHGVRGPQEPGGDVLPQLLAADAVPHQLLPQGAAQLPAFSALLCGHKCSRQRQLCEHTVSRVCMPIAPNAVAGCYHR